MIGTVSGLIPLNRSMILNRQFLFISVLIIFFSEKDLFGQSLFDFDESLSSKMDPDLWLRIRKKTNWQFCDIIIANYLLRQGSMTHSKDNIILNKKNLEIVHKRYLNRFELFIARIINYLHDINYKRAVRKFN